MAMADNFGSIEWTQNPQNLSKVDIILSSSGKSLRFSLESSLIRHIVPKQPCIVKILVRLYEKEEQFAVDFTTLQPIPKKSGLTKSIPKKETPIQNGIGEYAIFYENTNEWLTETGWGYSQKWFKIKPIESKDSATPPDIPKEIIQTEPSKPDIRDIEPEKPIIRVDKEPEKTEPGKLILGIIILIAITSFIGLIYGIISLFSDKGSLTVTIKPDAAVSAGALWRMDNGNWRSSGETVSDISAGSHTVEFKTVAGWITPTNQQVTIEKGNVCSAEGTYVYNQTVVPPPATGSLTVKIIPDEAVQTGAKWRTDSGSWQNSGQTVSGLSAGTHTLGFKEISGWITPASQTVTIEKDKNIPKEGKYVRQPQTTPSVPTGSLTVSIIPADAVRAGAKWKIEGYDWQNSGATIPTLVPGQYEVKFGIIPGWQKPDNLSVNIEKGKQHSEEGRYTPTSQTPVTPLPQTGSSGTNLPNTGSVTVIIKPDQAVIAGAKWRIEGYDWQDSGASIFSLPSGSYEVKFKPVYGWQKPDNMTVTIQDGRSQSVEGSYIR